MFCHLPNLIRGLLFAAVFAFLLSLGSATNAGCTDYFSCNKEIERVKKEISRLQGEEKTLANQIAYLDNQIYLTQLEIQAKQAEIEILSVDIGDLSVRLERIGNFLDYQEEIFVGRARLAYASDQLSPFDIVLGAESLDDALRRIKYLRVLEDQDIQSLNEMRDTRTSFDDQKTVLEGKKSEVERLKKEVEGYKASLITQQNSKKQLLEETKGEEARYQNMLKLLEAERQAIIRALSQRGVSLGPVKKGQAIARQGNTGCSSGPHIHYSVHKTSNLSTVYNPRNYVGVVAPSSCTSGFSLGLVVNGLFNRPPSSCNRLTQDYWWAHTALDMVSADGWVYASDDGEAYLVKDGPEFAAICRRMGYPYNGTGYGIRIDHGNGKTTSYWHIQP